MWFYFHFFLIFVLNTHNCYLRHFFKKYHSYVLYKDRGMEHSLIFRCGFVLWLTPDFVYLTSFISVQFLMVLWEYMTESSLLFRCVLYCISKLLPWLNEYLYHACSHVASVCATKQTHEPFKNVQLAFIMRPYHF